MKLKKLEDLQNGEISEFIQVYVDDKPEIFCKRLKGINEDTSYTLLRDVDIFNLEMIRSYDANLIKSIKYNLAIGSVTRDKEGVYFVWNFVGNPKPIDKEHLRKYSELHKDLELEMR